MKRSNKNSIITCEKIEQLLIQNNIERLTENELYFINNHVTSCSNCQRYQNILENLHSSIEIKQNTELIPDPSISNYIIKRMKTQKPIKIDLSGMIWDALKKTLAYRIPVYQAVIGGVSIVLILFLINNIPTILEQDFPYQQRYNQASTTIPSQTNVIDNLDIINQQKIGRNVQEDTLLTKFITTVM